MLPKPQGPIPGPFRRSTGRLALKSSTLSKPTFLESLSYEKPVVQKSPSFKFGRLSTSSSSISSLLKHGSAAFPPTEIALLSPQVRAEHDLVTTTLRKALALDSTSRKQLFVEQDRRNQVVFDFQPGGRPISPDVLLFTIETLLPPTSSLPPSEALEVIRPLLAQVTNLAPTAESPPEALVFRLFSFTSTLPEALEVANFLFKYSAPCETYHINPPPPGAILSKKTYYLAMSELLSTVAKVEPLPPPTPIIDFIKSYPRLIRAISYEIHPLGRLLEIYNSLFELEQNRLQRGGSEAEERELKERTAKYLLVVREIHEAMKEVKPPLWSRRNCNSLVDGYGRGKGFDEAFEVWDGMMKEGGVGVDSRSVSVFFDLCGFAAKPSLAISTLPSIEKILNFNDNNWSSYSECLTRCGSWVDLLAFHVDQAARHKLDPIKNPPLTPEGVAVTLKFARKCAFQGFSTGRRVGPTEFGELEDGLKGLLSEEESTKVEGLMRKKRVSSPEGPKSGPGARV